MALSDQPFISSKADNVSENKLHCYCSPLDTFAKGVLDNRSVEQIRQNLREYLVCSDLQDQLPPDICTFAGRQTELKAILTQLKSAAQGDQRDSAAVITIIGRAGVGKSTLAVHAAYQLKRSYPDAQLYVNLHSSDSKALSPEAAIAALLQAWDESDGWLPATLKERQELYQSLLSNKRALIILDDVGDAAQIAPLIPQGKNCAVLITSRHSLEGLATTAQFTLAEMSEDDSLQLLLQAAVGHKAVSLDLAAATQIVNLCRCDPLAIQIAACTLQDVSSEQLLTCVSQLTAEHDRQALLNPNDFSVRASFSLSSQTLDDSCMQLFRRLSLAAQPILTDSMAKMLLASDLEVAKAATAILLERQLLKQIDQHRYQFQPLLRLIAKEKLAQTEPSKLRQAVRMRITRWYLKKAEEMSLIFHPTTRSQLFRRLSEESSMLLPDGEKTLRLSALRWFQAEHPNLMACLNWAHQAKAWNVVTQFAKHLVIFFEHGAYWQDWERSHQLALEGARKLGNRQLEAQILTNLGNSFFLQERWEKAKVHYETSISLFQEVGDLNGKEMTSRNLSLLYHFSEEEKTESTLRKTSENNRLKNTNARTAAFPDKNVSARREALQNPVKTDADKSAPLVVTRDVYIIIASVGAAIFFIAVILILL